MISIRPHANFHMDFTHSAIITATWLALIPLHVRSRRGDVSRPIRTGWSRATSDLSVENTGRMAESETETGPFVVLKTIVVSSKVISGAVIKSVTNSVRLKEEETVFVDIIHKSRPDNLPRPNNKEEPSATESEAAVPEEVPETESNTDILNGIALEPLSERKTDGPNSSPAKADTSVDQLKHTISNSTTGMEYNNTNGNLLLNSLSLLAGGWSADGNPSSAAKAASEKQAEAVKAPATDNAKPIVYYHVSTPETAQETAESFDTGSKVAITVASSVAACGVTAATEEVTEKAEEAEEQPASEKAEEVAEPPVTEESKADAEDVAAAEAATESKADDGEKIAEKAEEAEEQPASEKAEETKEVEETAEPPATEESKADAEDVAAAEAATESKADDGEKIAEKAEKTVAEPVTEESKVDDGKKSAEKAIKAVVANEAPAVENEADAVDATAAESAAESKGDAEKQNAAKADEQSAENTSLVEHKRRRKIAESNAATKIQSLQRQRLAKQRVQAMKDELAAEEQHRAASLNKTVQNHQLHKNILEKHGDLAASEVDEVTSTLHDLLALADPNDATTSGTLMDLLEAKADLNIPSEEGYTAMALACYYQSEEVVRKLVSLKANLDVVGPQGDTILIATASRNPSEPEIVTFLMGYPEVTKTVNACESSYHSSALFLMCQEHENHASCENAIKLLLDIEDAIVDIVNNSGVTPLMMAVSNGAHKVAEMLINHGADPNAIDNRGNSAFSIAQVSADDEMWQIVGGEFEDDD